MVLIRTDLPVRVSVTIADDRVKVDYAGSAPQAAGGVNGSFATMNGAGAVPVLMCLDPDIPHNEGCISHVEVSAEEGSICWAKFPASTSCATIVPSRHDARRCQQGTRLRDPRPRRRRHTPLRELSRAGEHGQPHGRTLGRVHVQQRRR